MPDQGNRKRGLSGPPEQQSAPITPPLLASYLDSSRVVHLALLRPDGSIASINQTFAECLMLDGTAASGQELAVFLTEPDGKRLAAWLAGTAAIPQGLFLLNAVSSDQVVRTLHCRLGPVEGGFLLLAEPAQDDNRSLQEELLQLNNQLAVLSRENIRKGRELARTLADLKKAQAMLVHQEKMASLGLMTAGIAHEINNPVAFVLNNEQVLQRDFSDLQEYITALGDVLPTLASRAPDIHAAIVAKADQVELDYLAGAIPRKIAANIEGLERVRKIVLDLRNFSRLDEARQQYCDLTEGIKATLRFLGPLLQESGVTLETDFTPLAPLLCLPGPLNQAVSNITVNSIQASAPGQTVRIATWAADSWYVIEVADHGSGIAPEHLTTIFDPFFTTKPVGSGTGLGLSIAHQVVAAHGGRIEIDSRTGVGTTVQILLPVAGQSVK